MTQIPENLSKKYNMVEKAERERLINVYVTSIHFGKWHCTGFFHLYDSYGKLFGKLSHDISWERKLIWCVSYLQVCHLGVSLGSPPLSSPFLNCLSSSLDNRAPTVLVQISVLSFSHRRACSKCSLCCNIPTCHAPYTHQPCVMRDAYKDDQSKRRKKKQPAQCVPRRRREGADHPAKTRNQNVKEELIAKELWDHNISSPRLLTLTSILLDFPS